MDFIILIGFYSTILFIWMICFLLIILFLRVFVMKKYFSIFCVGVYTQPKDRGRNLGSHFISICAHSDSLLILNWRFWLATNNKNFSMSQYSLRQQNILPFGILISGLVFILCVLSNPSLNCNDVNITCSFCFLVVCCHFSLLHYSCVFHVRIQASFQLTGTKDFLEHKKILSLLSWLQWLSTLETCPFIQQKSKFMNCSPGLGKLKR